MDKLIRYPVYPAESRLERLIVRLGFAGVAKCPVCGRFAGVAVRGENLRETCLCLGCRSTNRQRQVAFVVCRVIGGSRGRRLGSLRGLAAVAPGLAVYNTEARGPIHEALSALPGYVGSEYFGERWRSGDRVNGVLHQDLHGLSLASESLDLVVSSDVLEHVPDPYRAHREIHRVLRWGGRHVFTVPFYQTEYLDERRAIVEGERTVFLKEALYHEDPLRPEGALVYTIFSLEMLVRLRRIGFRTNLYRVRRPLRGIWGSNGIVFDAIKETPGAEPP